MTRVLVTGFGPFGSVVDNPASRVARALDGEGRDGFVVIGREVPVSYTRGIDATVQLAREHRVDLVLGIGVSRRAQPELERIGRARLGRRADVDGSIAPPLSGASEWRSSLPLDRWAHALGCAISDDAGGYVCNAWLHQVGQRLEADGIGVGFLHVPPEGLDPGWLVDGLARVLTSEDPS